MATDTPEKPVTSRPIMERHLQTLLLALVAGLISWQGFSTLKLTESSARQDERVMHLIALTEQLRQDLRNLDSQYVTRRESDINRSELRSKLETLETRITRLENTL